MRRGTTWDTSLVLTMVHGDGHEQRATEALIAALADQARPVRRLAPPLVRAALWLAAATVVIGVLAVFHGLATTHGFGHMAAKFADGKFVFEWLASLATGLTAVIAAFHLALPDRSRRWRYLPLPALGLWLSAIGYGCLTDWVRLGPDGFVLGTSFACFITIVGTSLPVGLLMAVMLRHAEAAWPVETITVGALGVAALSATGLGLYHEIDATLMILIWHGGTVAAVVLAARLVGRRMVERRQAHRPEPPTLSPAH